VGILFALFIAIKTIMSVIIMEKKKNQKWYKLLDPIINTIFSISFVLARVDLRAGEGISYAPLHIVVD
jgi:hypothetical protein